MSEFIVTKDGRKIELLSEEEDRIVTAAAWADPDAQPYTEEEWKEVERQVEARRQRKLAAK